MTELRRNLTKAALCAVAVAAIAAAFAGCNTVKGVGKDVEGAGKAIQGE